MAVNKHVRQMQKNREEQLRKKAMRALRASAAVARLTKKMLAKRKTRTVYRGFQILKTFVLIRRREKLSEDRAVQFRQFNLKIKALTAL